MGLGSGLGSGSGLGVRVRVRARARARARAKARARVRVRVRVRVRGNQRAGVRRAGGQPVPRKGSVQTEEAAQRGAHLLTRHEEGVELAWGDVGEI